MKTLRSLIAGSAAGLVAMALLAPPLAAAPLEPIDPAGPTRPLLLIQSDCYAVGEQVAAQNGGTLAKASPSTQGGRPVCVIVVLVPGKDGQRPRRTEIVVPQ
jgi:hypothetical protein